MRLQPGDRLGSYEILDAIGAGGMGEVYRARDTRLDRLVAIKVLPAAVSGDPERLARFEREAKTLAALNHTNVAQIYSTETVAPVSLKGATSDPLAVLAMEFVEGIDLSARIAHGPVPLDDALDIAGQVALALEAAHEFGIIHRDLKPSNIRLREDGTVKVLDFGLAKALSAPASAIEKASAPTITTPAMTHQGMVLGTAAYMSPEQAKGKAADKRADVWAFGVILYEMTTGRRPFDGETVSESLAGVLKSDPDLQPAPAEIRRLLRSCLEKDPKKRLRDIGDWRRQLDEPDAAMRAATPARSWLAWSTAGALALAAAVLAVLNFGKASPTPQPVSFQILAPSNTALGVAFSVSPDGRRVAFSASGADGIRRLWVRDIGGLDARLVAGTDGAGGAVSWSPDGRSLAFLAGRTLKRVDVAGGSALTIHEGQSAETMGGAAWGPDGVLVFGGTRSGAIRRVSESGGTATPLTAIDQSRGEIVHGIPSMLPDGRHFLYVRVSADDAHSGIYVGSVDAAPETQPGTRLVAASHAMYFEAADGAGYLLYLRQGTLLAHPFDADRLALAGEPVAVAEGVGNTGAFGFFSAGAGVVAYRSGPRLTGGVHAQLTWLDRTGKPAGTVGQPDTYDGISLSPASDRAAVIKVERAGVGLGNVDVWVLDLDRGVPQRLTSATESDRSPVWSPEGDRIAYFSASAGRPSKLYVMSSRSGGSPQLLVESERVRVATTWSRDGRFLLFHENDPATGWDIWLLPLEGDRKPVPLVRTKFSEVNARFSPDARWIAYTSNESGRDEIYVRPFNPAAGSSVPVATRISTDEGRQARWRRDGKELIFQGPDTSIMSVDLTIDAGGLRPGLPTRLFTLSDGYWDVTADGQKFLVARPMTEAGLGPINILVNWAAEKK